jgi:hypothetical protein
MIVFGILLKNRPSYPLGDSFLHQTRNHRNDLTLNGKLAYVVWDLHDSSASHVFLFRGQTKDHRPGSSGGASDGVCVTVTMQVGSPASNVPEIERYMLYQAHTWAEECCVHAAEDGCVL